MDSEQERIESIFDVDDGCAFLKVTILFCDESWLRHSNLLRLDVIDEGDADV